MSTLDKIVKRLRRSSKVETLPYHREPGPEPVGESGQDDNDETCDMV